MNISIAIADSNREYVERLSEVLQQYPELDIHIYTNIRNLQTALGMNRFDIVLFDPDISDERLVFPGVSLPICLWRDDANYGNFYADANTVKVRKYQQSSWYSENDQNQQNNLLFLKIHESFPYKDC